MKSAQAFSVPSPTSLHSSLRPVVSLCNRRSRPARTSNFSCFRVLRCSQHRLHGEESKDRLDTEQLDSLRAWCTANGVRFHKVEIQSSHGYRGLRATAPTDSGDLLISIPSKAAIVADAVNESPPSLYVLRNIAPSFWAKASWETRLAIQLLDECARGSDSPFSSYIYSLPSDPWSALWAYEIIGRERLSNQLRPYRMHGIADAYRSHVKSTFVRFQSALPEESRKFVTLKMFSWATAICQSRAFGIPLKATEYSQDDLSRGSPRFRKKKHLTPVRYALFPGLDMANHSVHCQTSFKYDPSLDRYNVSTGSQFSRDQEVLLSYGSKSNDDLMFFYGFAEGNNPANTVKITDLREWILELAHRDHQVTEDWDRKLELLIGNGLTHPEKLFEFRLSDICDELMRSLRLAVATNGDLEMVLRELETNPDRLEKPISLENEVSCWHAIEEKCQQLLDELGEFSPDEQEQLTEIYSKQMCSGTWVWGEEGSAGELIYRYERQEVLRATAERVRHFAQVSSAVGRICTVLLPPSQSLLKTDVFSGPGEEETAGVHKFFISPEDLPISEGIE